MANANPFIVGGGNSNAWNYSDPNRDGFTNTISGTVTKLTYRQAIDFNTKGPKFYDDGHPAMCYVVTVTAQDGNKYDWVFDAKKSSQAVLAIGRATGKQPGEPVDIMAIAGHLITVTTPGLQSVKTPTGRTCTARVWKVQLGAAGPIPFEGTEVIDPAPYPGNATAAPVQQAQPVMQAQPMAQQPVQQVSYQQLQQMATANTMAAQPHIAGPYDEEIPF